MTRRRARVLGEAPDPVAGAGHVVVDVAVAGVTFAEAQMRADTDRWHERPALPFISGGMVAGRVSAAGDGVDPPLLGRRVLAGTGGTGGFAERTVSEASELIPAEPGRRRPLPRCDVLGGGEMRHGNTCHGWLRSTSCCSSAIRRDRFIATVDPTTATTAPNARTGPRTTTIARYSSAIGSQPGTMNSRRSPARPGPPSPHTSGPGSAQRPPATSARTPALRRSRKRAEATPRTRTAPPAAAHARPHPVPVSGHGYSPGGGADVKRRCVGSRQPAVWSAVRECRISEGYDYGPLVDSIR
ncbi:alcohol dehydrogenase catalytic domain-containing protein [Embleya sp. NPDC127516]|uniref:alcohol dehydrogenase catalytic domain-containing protein n=1 Tax=Embleya sp. NPDC127516 TaxID=3363990 RepID=UPI0037F90692